MSRLISIVIPTFGRPTTLKRSIISVLNQTYSEIEVIVVDDNNPFSSAREKTEFLISKFDDSRLVYIKHNKNRNGAAARNTGISIASGYYIAFLDDDDEFEREKIEKQLLYIEHNSHFGAVYCKSIYLKNDIPYYYTKYNKEGNIQFDVLTMAHEFNTSSLLVHKKYIKAIGGFNEKFMRHQDYDFLLRLNRRCLVGCVNEYLLRIYNDDVINQPPFNQYEINKMTFLSEFKAYISQYKQQEINMIYRIHYFDLFYYALKNRIIGKSMKYLFRSKPNIKMINYVLRKTIRVMKRMNV